MWTRRGLLLSLILALALTLPPISEYFQRNHFRSSVAYAQAANVVVNGSQRYQRIDGFGVNANPKNWRNGELIPALDYLVDTLNARIWRVDVYGTSNWEATNDDSDPFNFNWAYYNVLYETPEFQSLWSTLGYLNQKDVQLILSASGVVPDWMGGQSIVQEDEWVEQIASLAYYGRNVRQLQFGMLSPLNETDLGPPEGPRVSSTQFASLLRKLALRLDALGLGDIKFIAPDSAGIATDYLPPMFDDPVIMSRIEHFAFHSYSGTAGGAYDVITNRFPDRNLWMTEWSQGVTDGGLYGGQQVRDEWAFARVMADYGLRLLYGGAGAVLAWDGFENVHDHDGTNKINAWGILAYDPATGIYSPKKRAYTTAQFFKFVSPGSYAFDASISDSRIDAQAFYDSVAGKLTIVGHNTSSSVVTMNASLVDLAAPSALASYYTNSSLNLARGSDIPVTDGSFSVQIPADTFFTFTNVDDAVPPPSPSPTAGPPPSPATTASATRSPTLSPGGATFGFTGVGSSTDTADSNHLNGSRFQAPSGGQLSSMSVFVADVDSPPQNQYQLAIYSDANGRPGALLAQSSTGTLAPFAWNIAPIAASVAAGTNYWLIYNANGRTGAVNNMRFDVGTSGQGVYTASEVAYGSWPSTFPASTSSDNRYSIYASYAASPTAALTPSSTRTPTPSPTNTRTWTPTPTATLTASPSSTPTISPTPVPQAQTVTFDDLANPGRPLSGQYPTGLIDWGSSNWYLSGPYGQFQSRSIGFNGPGPTSGSFTFMTPRRLMRVDAYNGGNTASTISLACDGAQTRQATLPPGQGQSIPGGGSRNCGTITIGSTNGWATNFDNLVVDVVQPTATPTSTATRTRTATPTLTATQTRTATPSATSTSPPTATSAPTSANCPCSIWTSAAPPAATSIGPPVELGLKFRSDQAGSITGIRFYKPTSEVGTHRVNLWHGSGNLLATATSSGESLSGWQQVPFPVPVAISANTTYVVSYRSNGSFAYDEGSFNSTGVDRPPLHALRSGVDGPNGVYLYGGESGFPTNTFNASNYWVDVVFMLPPPTPTPAPPTQAAFNDLQSPNRSMNGEYPAGTIDWGANAWYLSGPYGQLQTNSVGFNGPGPTSASFTFLSPRRLLRLDVFNGGNGASQVTLSCPGQPTVQVTVALGQLAAIDVGWTGTCSTVTVGSSNGWDTNFDNFAFSAG